MKTRDAHLFRFAGLLAAALVLAFAPASSLPVALAANAQALQVDVAGAWSRPAIAGGNGAVYFTLTNRESEPVILVGVSSPVARYAEIHETYAIDGHEAAGPDHSHGHEGASEHAHGRPGENTAAHPGPVLAMRKIDQLTIASGETVEFAPGGYHVMLIELERTLAWGDRFALTLHFADGRSAAVEVVVGAEGS